MAEKERKPLVEALLEKKNGIDVLVKLITEGREEKKKEEEKAPDIFSGFSNIFGLILLPMIIPLIQEMMTRTLTQNTLNVKIESSVAMLPISIETSTAIIPIEIKASSTTINVNIASSTTTINVKVTGDANIIISGQTVGVSLAGTYSTLFGNDVTIVGEILGTYGEGLKPGEQNASLISWTNDTGKTVMVEGFALYGRPLFDSPVFNITISATLYIEGNVIGVATISREKMSDVVTLLRAIRVPPGSTISMTVSNFGTIPIYVYGVVYAYVS